FNPYGYPPTLQNGTITIKIWNSTPAGPGVLPVRLRTDAAEEQGRVSYLDLPYDFTAINRQPVSQVDLGGQVFSAPEPELNAPRLLDAAPTLNTSGQNSYTATLTYSNPTTTIATLTSTPPLLTSQPLQITPT